MPLIDPNADATAFLTAAPADLAGWVAALGEFDLPVLSETAELIEAMRIVEDDVDAHAIAEAIAEDPLMILKLLRHVALMRRPTGREHTDSETAVEALVMLGITPFFREFGPQTSIEQCLANHPLALPGLREVLTRSRRAARFALGFAIHRQDQDARVIHEAALLHDFAEILLWVRAPSLALKLAQLEQTATELSSLDLQSTVLNVSLSEIQQALMKAWRLPELLVRISDDETTEQSQVRNVQLAIRIARHSSRDWENPALTADVEDLSRLISVNSHSAWSLLRDLDC